MEFSLFVRTTLVIVYLLIVLLPAVRLQNVVLTATYEGHDTQVGIEGEPLDFLCTTDVFDTTQDQAEIYFQEDLLVTYTNNNNFVFNTSNRPESYYEAQIYQSATEVVTGIGVNVKIRDVHKNDAGEYQCIMILSGVRRASISISINVKQFPTPSCFAPHSSNDIAYHIRESDGYGELNAQVGIDVRAFCSTQTGENYVPVSLEWSRDDGKIVSQSGLPNLASVLFVSSFDDDGVTFNCMSKNTTYPHIDKFCAIQVFVSQVGFVLGSTDKIFQSTKHVPLTTLTSVNTYTGITTPSHMSNSTAANLPLPLIIGASGVTGTLLLILIIIICICVTRRSKRNEKRTSTVRLVNQRPSQDIGNLPRFSIDSFDSVISDIDDERPKSRFNYENTDPTNFVHPILPNIEEESDQASSSLTTKQAKSLIGNDKSRISYENSENGHFVLPPLEDNEQTKTSSGLRNFIAENDVKDNKINNLNLATSNDYHPQNIKTSVKNIPATKPIENDTDEPPVYADVKKNINKSISSITSDQDDDIPRYAMVNKDRKGKTQSRVPTLIAYACTEEAATNRELEESSLHYADVEMSEPASFTKGARGRKSSTSSALYASVPD